MAICEWAGRVEVRAEMVGVRGASFDPQRRGPKLTFEAWDNTGRRRAVLWTPAPGVGEALVQASNSDAPWVYVWGRLETKPGYDEQLTLTDIGFLAEGEWPDTALWEQELPPDHAQMVEALDRLIGSVRNGHLASLLRLTLGEGGRLRECFLKATAAKANHHAYPGGLLHHSLQVAEIALHTRGTFPGMNRDLLLTAALLHDVGKLWEMQQGWQSGQYTEEGHLLGHIVSGAEEISQCCRRLKFPRDLRVHLVHAICSHHEKLEFGSPVKPLTAEAIAIAKSDQISAELTQFFDAQARQAGSPERLVRRGDKSFWVGVPESLAEGAETADENLGDEDARPETDLRDLPPPHAPQESDPEERLMRRLAKQEQAPRVPVAGMAELPLLGLVAASDGIRAGFEDGGEPETRPVLIPHGGADFALQVVGDSMTGAGILDGDLLIVRKQDTARPGQIVVALVPERGPVVKRLVEQGDRCFLASENAAYEPIPVTRSVRVQGVVVRLERELM